MPKLEQGRGRKSIANPARLVTGDWSSGYGTFPRQVPGARFFLPISEHITSLRRRYGLKNPEKTWSPFVSKATFVVATFQAAFVQSQDDKQQGSPLAFPGMGEFGRSAISPLRSHTTELRSLFPGAAEHPLDGPGLSSSHACPGAAQHPCDVHRKNWLGCNYTTEEGVSYAEPPAQGLSGAVWDWFLTRLLQRMTSVFSKPCLDYSCAVSFSTHAAAQRVASSGPFHELFSIEPR